MISLTLSLQVLCVVSHKSAVQMERCCQCLGQPHVFGWLMDHAIDGMFLSTATLLGAERSGEAPATVSPDYHQPSQSLWIFTSALTITSVGHQGITCSHSCGLRPVSARRVCSASHRLSANLTFSNCCVPALHDYETMKNA